MQELTNHKSDGLNDAIEIEVLDRPGEGGACHQYKIFREQDSPPYLVIKFQKGPIQETGINGISNESLLAILEHRLEGFQSGEFACEENGFALTGVKEALHWLHKRTASRAERGVEGTSTP